MGENGDCSKETAMIKCSICRFRIQRASRTVATQKKGFSFLFMLLL